MSGDSGILRLEGVTKRFGGLLALSDVSITVQRGEIFGIIGPNGAGKTTLFNCISGFFPPDGGKTMFVGQDITGSSPHKITALGIARTFQIPRVFQGLTALENVLSGAYLREQDKKKALGDALETLRFVGLEAKANTVARSLNTADKRMTELARAIATKPKIVLIDEVAAGLTDVEISGLIDKIREISKSGVTIMMIEHVMGAILPLVSRLAVLNYGAKIAEGPPQEVTKNQEVIRAYLGT